MSNKVLCFGDPIQYCCCAGWWWIAVLTETVIFMIGMFSAINMEFLSSFCFFCVFRFALLLVRLPRTPVRAKQVYIPVHFQLAATPTPTLLTNPHTFIILCTTLTNHGTRKTQATEFASDGWVVHLKIVNLLFGINPVVNWRGCHCFRGFNHMYQNQTDKIKHDDGQHS